MPDPIITRRNLPHWYMPGAERDRMLREQRAGLTVREHRHLAHKRLFAKYEAYLDRSSSFCSLKNERVATIIRDNLYHHHGAKYFLMAYCVMPNHVHVLLQPVDTNIHQAMAKRTIAVGESADRGSPLSSIMHSLKSYTAHEANKVLGRKGMFWQSESYDHWVRDDDELERIVNYIGANPVKANLVNKPEEWTFSSYHDRFVDDGDLSGWLALDRSIGGSPVE